METKFEHDFKGPFSATDLAEIKGYNKALRHVFMYLAEVTQYKPEKRMVDCVPLLELIEHTSNDLAALSKEEEKEMHDELQTLSNLQQ